MRGDTATGVFRIVQESLTNSLRHAAASTIQVDVQLSQGELEVSITDDGVGLAPPSAQRAFSGGLLGMRERAAALGGALEIASRPHGGTRVAARIPLNADIR